MTCIIDCETDSTNAQEAKLKFFGALDCETGDITILDFRKNVQIADYIKKHKILIGFNLKGFDRVVLENYGIDFEYKVMIDLWECLAPKGDMGFGEYNKDRLHDINPSLVFPNYKLKTIIEVLGLDKEGKGDIDYSIFQKDEWTSEEEVIIKTYLSKDLELTKKLFNWYAGIFQPLKPYLPEKDFGNYKHLTCTSGSLAYKVVCHLAKLKEEYNEREEARKLKRQSLKIEGGHHIHPKHEKVRGNIVCRDFISHYPSILIMYNLLEEDLKKVIKKLLSERLKAKKEGNKQLALALKVPLNSIYGTLGNATFKNIYNPQTASDCTRIGRELLKKYAKTLDVAGFIPLYGFTDSVYVGISKGLSEEDLDLVTTYYINQEKQKAPNPLDSFGLGVDGKYKFMWFIEKKDNNYLSVTEEDKIKIKGGLFDVNTPKSINKLFEDYISPKIIKELDVQFTEEELLIKLKELLANNPELSAEDYAVKDLSTYKSKTSLQYQISERYGSGTHALIPNIAGIGAGKNEKMKYCSFEEFKEHNLTIDSISIDRMMRYLKPFYSTKERVVEL